MKKRTAMWGLAFLGLVVAGLIAFSLRHRDPPPPTPPTWVDSRPWQGYIFSLASGTAPTGEAIIVAGGYVHTAGSDDDLRIVCYDEADGRVLWESRFPRSIPAMSRIPHLEVDRAGDVLVGWAETEFGSVRATVIEKLSGRDGHSLWEWQISGWRGTSRYQGIPKADAQGRVWATGIRQDTADKFTRCLALLDRQTGAPLWQQDFNAARDSADRLLSIAFLATGDAIVSVPPRGNDGRNSEPWLVQKVAAADGAIVWSAAFPRVSGPQLAPVECVLDEAQQQVVVFSYPFFYGVDDFRSTSLALGDGAERWARDYPRAQISAGFAEFIHLGKTGEIAAHLRHTWDTPRVLWWRWKKEGKWWVPKREIHVHEQAAIVHFSTRDGTLLRQEPFGEKNERASAVIRSPDGRVAACFLRHLGSKGDWRVMPEEDAVVPWNQSAAKKVHGDWSAPGFPHVAILTNSGRLAIAGTPDANSRRVWLLRVW